MSLIQNLMMRIKLQRSSFWTWNKNFLQMIGCKTEKNWNIFLFFRIFFEIVTFCLETNDDNLFLALICVVLSESSFLVSLCSFHFFRAKSCQFVSVFQCHSSKRRVFWRADDDQAVWSCSQVSNLLLTYLILLLVLLMVPKKCEPFFQ